MRAQDMPNPLVVKFADCKKKISLQVDEYMPPEVLLGGRSPDDALQYSPAYYPAAAATAAYFGMQMVGEKMMVRGLT